MDEMPQVLVGYATAAGSTAGIAERIAATLRESGCQVVCRPVGPDLDPGLFATVVVGSAVHNMAWLPAALDFLGRIPTVGDRHTWCFSVGGVTPRGRLTRRMAASEVRRIEQAFPTGLRVRGHEFFGGIIEMSGLPLWSRAYWRLVGGRPGDHRNWPALERWAGHIAAALSSSPAGPAGGQPPRTATFSAPDASGSSNRS